MKYFDNIGNVINIGDQVLVLVPKSDATYRKATIVDFKNPYSTSYNNYCDILVEYDIDRFYCDKPHYKQKKGDKLNFTHKKTKAWRSNSDIILYES